MNNNNIYEPLNKNLTPSVLIIDWITLMYCGALKTINHMDTRLYYLDLSFVQVQAEPNRNHPTAVYLYT